MGWFRAFKARGSLLAATMFGGLPLSCDLSQFAEIPVATSATVATDQLIVSIFRQLIVTPLDMFITNFITNAVENVFVP